MDNDSAKFPAGSILSLDLLSLVFDGFPIAISCKDYADGSGRFVLWNRKAESLWDRKSVSVLGLDDSAIFSSSEASIIRENDLACLNAPDEAFQIKEKTLKTSQRSIHVQTWRAPLKDENGNNRYLMTLTIEMLDFEKIRAVLEKQSKTESAVTWTEEDESLVRQIAHELNNPFAIIRGRCAQLLKLMDQHDCPTDAKRMLNSIAENIRVSATSVDKLLHRNFEKRSGDVAGGIDRDFLHDFGNLVAITKGKTSQVMRMVQEKQGPFESQKATDKLNAVFETIKRMESMLDAKSGRRRNV